jgi:hypothetical protein
VFNKITANARAFVLLGFSIPSSLAVDALCLLNLQLFVRCLLVLCPTTVAVWICSTVDGSSSSPNGTNAAVG